MKNFCKIILISLMFSGITFSSFAQKDKKTFQGTITFGITYAGSSLNPAQLAQLPSSQTVTFKECKSKTENVTGPVSTIQIVDGITKTQTVLIDYAGSKFALKYTSQQITEQMANTAMPVVTLTKDTKVIEGFSCKKAILATTQEDGTSKSDTIYYSDEIGCSDLNFSDTFKDVPGAVLEYTTFSPELDAKVAVCVKEVKKAKVSDNAFLIPSDYKEVTEEELKTMFGGGQ